MTELQFITLLKDWGGWFGAALMLIYVMANKIGPQWLASWFEERKAARKADEVERKARIEEERSERESIIKVYERLIDQSEHQSERDTEVVKFIANAAEAIHEFTRAIDANTQQLYRLTQVIYDLQKREVSNVRSQSP